VRRTDKYEGKNGMARGTIFRMEGNLLYVLGESQGEGASETPKKEIKDRQRDQEVAS